MDRRLMMNKPSVSIIIPHYNIPDLLMRCLKSIPVSEDIQVIVVDDNSPNADTYLERYPELSRPYLEFIRTTKGGGAGYARNVGLEHAKGKWLLFADADDFYVDNMDKLIHQYIDSKADLVYFMARSVFSDNINQPSGRYTYNDLYELYWESHDEKRVRYNHWVPWAKMVKRELVEKYKLLFDEVQYANDVYFSVRIGFYAQQIDIANQILYVVTTRPDSLVSSFCKKPNELSIRADVHFRVHKFLSDNHIVLEDMPFEWISIKMLENNKKLFNYYFKRRIEELYPSKWHYVKTVTKNYSTKFRIKFYLYLFLIMCCPFRIIESQPTNNYLHE